MRTTEIKLLTNCCNSGQIFAPPSLGESGRYFCDKCLHEISIKEDTHVIVKELFIRIGQGHYRKAES
jgi:hypothetical protein